MLETGRLVQLPAVEVGLLAGRPGPRGRVFPPHAPLATGPRQPAEPPILPLLDIDEALGARPPLTAIAGIADQGRPVLLDLLSPETSHVLVVAGHAWGKSTLLRTLVGSLCLRARPWQMGILGVDLSGNELPILEAVPHQIAPLACEVSEAGGLLAWLEAETEARLDRQIVSPAIVLVVDDIRWLADPDQSHNLRRLVRMLRIGGRAGVHVLAAVREPPPPELAALFGVHGSVLAVGGGVPTRGVFAFRTRGWERTVQAAYLPAWDLHRLVARVSGRAARTARATMARAGAGRL